MTIQSYKGLGLWTNRASLSASYTNHAWLERSPVYNCTGAGTYTYRVITDGWANYDVHEAIQSAQYITYYC